MHTKRKFDGVMGFLRLEYISSDRGKTHLEVVQTAAVEPMSVNYTEAEIPVNKGIFTIEEKQ